MHKILCIGDIHGRFIWDDIIKVENPDKIIFLGDYVDTHEDISPEQQLANLEDILNYKESNPDKVVLLRGNHDTSELGYWWAQCSGFNSKVYAGMSQIKERFLSNTQWIYIENNIIYSHAGVSKDWMRMYKIKDVNDINNIPPDITFSFTPTTSLDIYGTSRTQPCTWIRPTTLTKCNIEGYTQVVGHTPMDKIVKLKANNGDFIWLCDSLEHGNYLVINDNEFESKHYEE